MKEKKEVKSQKDESKEKVGSIFDKKLQEFKDVDYIKYQERDPFEDFLDDMDTGAERRLATEEEQAEMDRSLKKLSQLFDGVEGNWQLDGAINISIAKGEYIGVHKDVDVSLEKDDLKNIEKVLFDRGYGFFLSYAKDEQIPKGIKVMERVHSDDILNSHSEHLILAAINSEGIIKDNEDLNFIDLHLINRNEDNQVTGFGDVIIPEGWTVHKKSNFKDMNIHTSHPAKVAYYKLHSERGYDLLDLKHLVENSDLSLDEINQLEELLLKEKNEKFEAMINYLKAFLPKLNLKMSKEDIYSLFKNDPVINEKMKDMNESFIIFSEKIANSNKIDFETLLKFANESFHSEDYWMKMKFKLDQLREWLKESK